MPTNTDWAFDVEEHVLDHYAEAIQFTPDSDQRYPDRIVGTVTEEINGQDYRAVIFPKPVGYDNAQRYRRWVTLSPIHWSNLTARPNDWRHFVLMIGLLPDGQPWWSALYEERILAEARVHSENMGGFYRFDPGLASKALIAEWDKDKPEEVDPPREEVSEPIPIDPGDDGGRRPAERRAIKEVIDAGVSLMLDQSDMVLLDDKYLAGLETRLEAATRNVAEWRVVRDKQSGKVAR